MAKPVPSRFVTPSLSAAAPFASVIEAGPGFNRLWNPVIAQDFRKRKLMKQRHIEERANYAHTRLHVELHPHGFCIHNACKLWMIGFRDGWDIMQSLGTAALKLSVGRWSTRVVDTIIFRLLAAAISSICWAHFSAELDWPRDLGTTRRLGHLSRVLSAARLTQQRFEAMYRTT